MCGSDFADFKFDGDHVLVDNDFKNIAPLLRIQNSICRSYVEHTALQLPM